MGIGFGDNWFQMRSLMNSEHIKIEVTERGVEVVIDDWELFDYVDDFITDRGLEYDYFYEQERQGRRYFKMHFAEGVSASRVSEVLKEIPIDEVERIWALNNG